MTGNEQPARCGSIAFGFKLTCDLDRGHVQGEDDWHQGAAETRQETATYEWTTTELVRWAPAVWEIPKLKADTPDGK